MKISHPQKEIATIEELNALLLQAEQMKTKTKLLEDCLKELEIIKI